ncbi:hypothetical protein EYC84_008908 [Monilinia fructicola]|uniref:Uncharacterized protein n=1 Tax=Monilinia fructicola TaxID=38448 RepID=A0A5M9JEH9_MONFR|nr:hypothetical protein EYC84_008908 [Monilinia fructicola]
MAPLKRARHEEEDIIATESASSALRHDNQRKRARTSNDQSPPRSSQPRDGHSSSSEGSSDDDQDEEMPMPPATQYEILRDAGFKHLEHAEHDDMIATQHFLAKNQMIGDNHAADNSIIEHIQCVNFMNHQNLNVPLGPLINFVVGMNGSGKSAVLTGITLCLGGKPSATNRGSSMKSLIKSGTERGMLMRGVQLEQLDNDYKLVSETCDQIGCILDESVGDLKGLERQAEEAESKKRIYDQHQDMRVEKRLLRNQLTWHQVDEQESELEERRRTVSETQRTIEKKESIVEEKDRAYQLLHIAVERALEKVRVLGEELAPIKEEEQEAKLKADEADSEVKRIHQEHKASQGELKQARIKAQKIQREIEAEQQRIEDANGGSLHRKFAEIEAAKNEASQAKAELERSHQEMQKLMEKSQASKIAVEKEHGPWTAKRKEVEICRDRLKEMQKKRPDPMSGFDRRMPDLLQRIQQDRGFRQKPVGPIGLYVKLRDPKWAHILEKSLGNILNSFVVTNKEDQARLQKIISAMGIPRTQIHTTNPQPIDTTDHQPDQHYMTILRMLDIENELVRNILIINQAIDQVLLVEDLKEAMRIMDPRSRPAKVRYCFSHNPGRRGWGVRLYLTGPNLQNSAQDYVRPYEYGFRMKTDTEGRITLQQETLKQLQEEESKLAKNCHILQQRAEEAERAIQKYKITQGRTRIRVQKAEERVESLESELTNLDIEDGFLDSLKKQLEEANGDVAHYENAYGATGIAKAEYNTMASEKRNAHKAVKKRIELHEQLIADATQKAKAKEQARSLALGEKNSAITQVDAYKSLKAEAEAKLANQEARVENYIKEATGYASISEQLQQYSRRLGVTEQEIVDGYVKAHELLKSFKSRRKHMEELLRILKQSFSLRMKQYRSFQRHISARSRINFNYLLSERAFRGRLSIDHKARLLDVHVEPDETSSNKKGRQTKTLSGGEKSFSSICLLLSLWEAMGAPLRCLDEFDVFMDDVNRDVSTKMIISAARRAVGRQFILITPKALGAGIEVGEDVKIHKLDDPRERNQRSIPEMIGATQ